MFKVRWAVGESIAQSRAMRALDKEIKKAGMALSYSKDDWHFYEKVPQKAKKRRERKPCPKCGFKEGVDMPPLL